MSISSYNLTSDINAMLSNQYSRSIYKMKILFYSVFVIFIIKSVDVGAFDCDRFKELCYKSNGTKALCKIIKQPTYDFPTGIQTALCVNDTDLIMIPGTPRLFVFNDENLGFEGFKRICNQVSPLAIPHTFNETSLKFLGRKQVAYSCALPDGSFPDLSRIHGSLIQIPTGVNTDEHGYFPDPYFLIKTKQNKTYGTCQELSEACSLENGWLTGCFIHESTGIPIGICWNDNERRPIDLPGSLAVWKQRYEPAIQPSNQQNYVSACWNACNYTELTKLKSNGGAIIYKSESLPHQMHKHDAKVNDKPATAGALLIDGNRYMVCSCPNGQSPIKLLDWILATSINPKSGRIPGKLIYNHGELFKSSFSILAVQSSTHQVVIVLTTLWMIIFY